MLIGSVGNKTQTNIAHILVRSALGLIVSSHLQYFQYRRPCHTENLLAPLGPFTREVTKPTSYSGLSHGTVQTNKHNHLNAIKGCVSRNDNRNYKTYKEFCHKDAILTRQGPLTRDNYPTFPVLVWVRVPCKLIRIIMSSNLTPEILLRKRKHIKTFGILL